MLKGKHLQCRTKYTSIFYESGEFVVRASYDLRVKLATITPLKKYNSGANSWKIKTSKGETSTIYSPSGRLPRWTIDRYLRGPFHLYNVHRVQKQVSKGRLATSW